MILCVKNEFLVFWVKLGKFLCVCPLSLLSTLEEEIFREKVEEFWDYGTRVVLGIFLRIFIVKTIFFCSVGLQSGGENDLHVGVVVVAVDK